MKKILVIDDDKTTVIMVEALLEDNGYTVLTAEDGAGGLEKARLEQPDVIILDRQMPEMDGNQVLMELKADDNISKIPVVMLTGDDRVGDISTSLALGAVDYIVKPFGGDNFLIRLNRVIQQG